MEAATSSSTKRVGLGCSIALAGALVALVVVAIVGVPRLMVLLNGERAVVPTAAETNDETNDTPEEFAARQAEELSHLESYGWVDEAANVAHMPIDQAMALLAAEGLPVGAENAGNQDGATADPAPDQAPDLSNVTYYKDVLPIFEARCSECHGADDPEEGLELTRYRTALVGSMNGPVIEPGDPEASYLVEQIVEGQMPKRDDPLPQVEIDIITAWIEAGAPEGESGE